MARAVEQIEQDLETLEEAIAFLKAEFHSTYSQYLTLLGQAVRRQLILASYQVCTQGYPEPFLSLSVNQRQKLQQLLRQLGGKAQEQLVSHLNPSKTLTDTEATDNTEQTLQPLPGNSDNTGEQLHQSDQEQLPVPLDMPLDSDAPTEVSASADITKSPGVKPEQLVAWQEQLEAAITQTLQTISLETNRLLQQSGIIPKKLPPAVLEAAAKVEPPGDATAGAPNLLNLLMETEGEGDSEDSTLTRIVAINLRLSEIEFAEPTLSAIRKQIRNLSAKGSKLQRQYHKKQKERSVAQAEAAWRASWVED